MTTTMLEAWEGLDAPWRASTTPRERLRALVPWAVLAPSGHNTQPWRFRVADDALELRADRTRALPEVDPDDRELTISCGAALYNVRAALRHFGHAGEVELLPGPGDPDLLARVRVGAPRAPTLEEEALFAAIPERATCRRPFAPRGVPSYLAGAMRRAVEEEGGWLAIVDGAASRAALAELVAEGDRVQGADAAIRRELAAWVRPNHARRRDGIPGYALGLSDLASVAGPVLLDLVPWGGVQARRDAALACAAPLLVVLGTARDAPRDWLVAGQGLQRMLLRAASEGLAASFLNAPLELPGLRLLARDTLGLPGWPQLVLRLGYAPPARHTPRRSVEEVMEE